MSQTLFISSGSSSYLSEFKIANPMAISGKHHNLKIPWSPHPKINILIREHVGNLSTGAKGCMNIELILGWEHSKPYTNLICFLQFILHVFLSDIMVIELSFAGQDSTITNGRRAGGGDATRAPAPAVNFGWREHKNNSCSSWWLPIPSAAGSYQCPRYRAALLCF